MFGLPAARVKRAYDKKWQQIRFPFVYGRDNVAFRYFVDNRVRPEITAKLASKISLFHAHGFRQFIFPRDVRFLCSFQIYCHAASYVKNSIITCFFFFFFNVYNTIYSLYIGSRLLIIIYTENSLRVYGLVFSKNSLVANREQKHKGRSSVTIVERPCCLFIKRQICM